MLRLKKKTLSRREWSWLGEKKQYTQPLTTPCFTGVASLFTLLSLPAPRHLPDGRIFADEGYQWLQIAPIDRHWWLTAVYNNRGELFESYLDISLYNDLSSEEEPFFTDLLLDAVAAPYEDARLLDEQELTMALEQGLITKTQQQLALSTAQRCMDWYNGHKEVYYGFLTVLKEELQKGLDGLT